jgi:hypothetical protein
MRKAELQKQWTVGAGFEVVQGAWMEDSYALETVWYVEAHNAYGERYYWRGVRDERHAKTLELIANKQLEQGRFDINRGAWQASGFYVYGSPAYAADWHEQEYLMMDDEERYHRGYR